MNGCAFRLAALKAEIGRRLGRKALEKVACVAKPDTIIGWRRTLIARKFDGSKRRAYPGRPRSDVAVEALIVRMARKNTRWGYHRIVGAMANLGHHVSDQTVGSILRRHDIPPAPKRSRITIWKEFIRRHMDVLAGADFFTVVIYTAGASHAGFRAINAFALDSLNGRLLQRRP